ncbi:hypothetical protein KC19_1G309300 [Ceratodon purpureus]|uniref:Uncharacterized protein n=1 Tax=Ceratodon purpureus TaxID=3225 RepID=A0A8T0JE63_CERPU|nr:hypothetical protein KC19_1G309300 [Ceratodon purpureus]
MDRLKKWSLHHLVKLFLITPSSSLKVPQVVPTYFIFSSSAFLLRTCSPVSSTTMVSNNLSTKNVRSESSTNIKMH